VVKKKKKALEMVSLKKHFYGTEGMPQAVECLLCKSEALSSNPTTPTKKKKKQKHFII
jgi:hypothetical protein